MTTTGLSDLPEELPDPVCMHCATPVTPCTCWRGRGCEKNGWMHIRTGEHGCPGMLTGAYPSSASLRALLSGTRVTVADFREAMGAWYRDAISDEALERGILAITPWIAAAARAAERAACAAIPQHMADNPGSDMVLGMDEVRCALREAAASIRKRDES